MDTEWTYLTREQWEKLYKPRYVDDDEEQGEYLGVTFDHPSVGSLNKKRQLWTEYDSGTIVPGAFFVNRFRYFATEVAFKKGDKGRLIVASPKLYEGETYHRYEEKVRHILGDLVFWNLHAGGLVPHLIGELEADRDPDEIAMELFRHIDLYYRPQTVVLEFHDDLES